MKTTTAFLVPILAAAAMNAAAQVQPIVAGNNQDEIINLDRQILPGTESFKILRSGDKSEINRYVSRVYELQHANPYEVLPYLRVIAALEKGNVVTAWNPQPDGTNRAWIQVNVPDFQIDYFDDVVRAYDVPDFASIPGDIKFSYRTKFRNAVEVAEFIRTTTLSPDGLIRGDAATNTIYVQDSPSDFLRVFSQIQFYDVPIPQLDVEVSIIELTDTDRSSLGLDWDAWKTALAGEATVYTSSTRDVSTAAGTLNNQSRGFEGFLTIDATAAARFLNYLAINGKAVVHARTNLSVGNNTVASISSGSNIPSFVYRYDTGIGKSVLTRATEAAPGDAGEGFSLSLMPEVAMESARMQVALLMRSPVSIDATGRPIFSEQQVTSEITLEQDQLYQIGGFRRRTETLQRKGIPILRDIPVVKYLFSNEATILQEAELFVFLQPRWSSPRLHAADAMRGSTPLRAELLSEILESNPNLSISLQDRALLDRYFRSTDLAEAPGE